MQPKRIAIVYFGLTRSTRYVYKSHFDKLINPLKAAGYDITVFLHTWHTHSPTVWNTVSTVPIDEEEYKYLQPKYYRRDNEDVFFESLDFSKYFNQKQWEKYGDGRGPNNEWYPQMVKNHLGMMESIRRGTQMVLESGETFDYILYSRPDVEYLNTFPVECLAKMGEKDIVLLNYKFEEGYNGNVTVAPFGFCKPFAFRIEEAAEFRSKHGRLVSEKFLRYAVDKYYNKKHFIDFQLKIVRPPA